MTSGAVNDIIKEKEGLLWLMVVVVDLRRKKYKRDEDAEGTSSNQRATGEICCLALFPHVVLSYFVQVL
jgi:hypothetical protein